MDHENETTEQFKQRVKRHLKTNASIGLWDWVMECVLHAYESGDIDDEAVEEIDSAK